MALTSFTGMCPLFFSSYDFILPTPYYMHFLYKASQRRGAPGRTHYAITPHLIPIQMFTKSIQKLYVYNSGEIDRSNRFDI